MDELLSDGTRMTRISARINTDQNKTGIKTTDLIQILISWF
jgi:hypothetical protein